MKMSFRVQGHLCLYDHSIYQEEYWVNEACVWTKALITRQGSSYSVRYTRRLEDPWDEKEMLNFLKRNHPHLLPTKGERRNLSRPEVVTLLQELFEEVTHLWVEIPPRTLSFPLWTCIFCEKETRKKRCCGLKYRGRSHTFNDKRDFFNLISKSTEELYDVIEGVVE